MKLGVFDSGIGGEAIAQSLRASFPKAEIITVNDRENLPYGDKTPDQIIILTNNAIQPLLSSGCDVIIIACNTATTAAIEILRKRYPDQKFIGIEPMIKPAATLTRTKTIAVCATPATLSSYSYHKLKNLYAKDISVIEPDCSKWATMIEYSKMQSKEIEQLVDDLCQNKADVIVLGCTHYIWIKDIISSAAARRAIIIEPSYAITSRVKRLLNQF